MSSQWAGNRHTMEIMYRSRSKYLTLHNFTESMSFDIISHYKFKMPCFFKPRDRGLETCAP